MKNLFLVFTLILAFAFTNNLNAQPTNTDNEVSEKGETKKMDSEEFAILQNYKATRTERKVIRKVKKYVTPRLFPKGTRTTALAGKTVTVQLSLDRNGAITNIQVIKGFEESIDAKVMKYVREYNENNPLADSKLERPATIQLEIPLAGRLQYMN